MRRSQGWKNGLFVLSTAFALVFGGCPEIPGAGNGGEIDADENSLEGEGEDTNPAGDGECDEAYEACIGACGTNPDGEVEEDIPAEECLDWCEVGYDECLNGSVEPTDTDEEPTEEPGEEGPDGEEPEWTCEDDYESCVAVCAPEFDDVASEECLALCEQGYLECTDGSTEPADTDEEPTEEPGETEEQETSCDEEYTACLAACGTNPDGEVEEDIPAEECLDWCEVGYDECLNGSVEPTDTDEEPTEEPGEEGPDGEEPEWTCEDDYESCVAVCAPGFDDVASEECLALCEEEYAGCTDDSTEPTDSDEEGTEPDGETP